MTSECKGFIAEDLDGFMWIIYSANSVTARIRLADSGIYTNKIRDLTEEEVALYEDEISVAKHHKNVAVFVQRQRR